MPTSGHATTFHSAKGQDFDLTIGKQNISLAAPFRYRSPCVFRIISIAMHDLHSVNRHLMHGCHDTHKSGLVSLISLVQL